MFTIVINLMDNMSKKIQETGEKRPRSLSKPLVHFLLYVFQNELSNDILSSGLVHEIDAKLTARGRQKRVTFPHKLLMDYLSAFYMCDQNTQENLEQVFPTWDYVKKHEEVMRAYCNLMKGRKEVMTHLIKVWTERIKGKWHCSWIFDTRSMVSFQDECKLENPLFVVYPCEGSLAKVLNTAKLVVIEELTGNENDSTMPCNADIVIIHTVFEDICGERALNMYEGMKTLKRYKDHIIAMHLSQCNYTAIQLVNTLLPSSSLSNLYMYKFYVPYEVFQNLARMPNLTYLHLCGQVDGDADDILIPVVNPVVGAVAAWNGQSQLRVLSLWGQNLPVSVCGPLLVAIATNCPLLETLDIAGNALSGSLAGLLQNPPPKLKELCLMNIGLESEDIESLAVAVTAGKLQHLELLDISSNYMLEEDVIPLLNALLDTLGDRKCLLDLGNNSNPDDIVLAPSQHPSVEYYLPEIRQALRDYHFVHFMDQLM